MQNYKRKVLVFHKKILEKDPALEFIQKLYQKFSTVEIYLVGGAVRDAILNKSNQKDYDFVIRNITPVDLTKFLSKYGKINLVGRSFGVYKFQPRKLKLSELIDIAFPRTEHAFGTGGYRDIEAKSDPKMPIEKDLERRDFTINALAWDLKNKRIIDPFCGLKDLKLKKIRAIGDPFMRFKEDYSRVLRGLRFACQFNFEFEKNTYQALCKFVPYLNDEKRVNGKKERVLPYEIIAKEFVKAFFYNPKKAFELYDISGVFKMIIPEILEMKNCPQPNEFHSEGDVWQHTKLILEKIESKEFKKEFGKKGKNTELVIAALFHDIGKPRTIKTPEQSDVNRIRFDGHDIVGGEIAFQICKRLKLDSLPENSFFRIEPKRIKQLIERHMLLVEGAPEKMRPATIERYFFNPNFPGENLLKLTFVDINASLPKNRKPNLKNFRIMQKRIKELRKQFEMKAKLPPPLLNGFEIMKYFKLKPGPKIGELIAELRNAQLNEKLPIKTKKEAYEFLERYLKKRNKK